MNFQRVIQGVSLSLFLAALWRAAYPLLPILPVDGFLRMDPIVLVGTLVADRQFAPHLWVAGLVLLLCLFLGRFFCAHVCPMGISIDYMDHLLRARRKSINNRQSKNPISRLLPPKRTKYQVLFFILGAGVLGVSFVFIASPLSLITRFFGLIIYPALSFLANHGLIVFRPVADTMHMTNLSYAVVRVPRYNLQWVTMIILFSIFACSLLSPRFWCRYLCPSGALFAIFSVRPIFRRQVSRECFRCGLCANICPMGAIGGDINSDGTKDPYLTNHTECIACLACVRVCPTQAISFACGPECGHTKNKDALEKISAERRRILKTALSGTATAIVTLTGLKSPHSHPGPGSIVHSNMIRPPGAVPENDFLARCIRCGECMKACPTNTLQPIGLEAGLSAFFSPVITARRGPCEPSCNVCGWVCPTCAITPLIIEEKLKAKVGTACIFRQKCLAWELEKKCLICDEVCPFDAIEFRKVPDIQFVVPFVKENKCAGCGFCEHYCPVQATPAIRVEPMLALRLSQGSYQVTAKQMGYSLEIKKRRYTPPSFYPGQEVIPSSNINEDVLPPGFTE